jgi:hypothetical protein
LHFECAIHFSFSLCRIWIGFIFLSGSLLPSASVLGLSFPIRQSQRMSALLAFLLIILLIRPWFVFVPKLVSQPRAPADLPSQLPVMRLVSTPCVSAPVQSSIMPLPI